jgi:hypothetical protein
VSREREADALAQALLGDDPRAALAALALTDPALVAVREAAERRLGAVRLEPGSAAARLLLAVSGHPGLSAAELAALPELAGVDTGRAGARLLAAGLVTSTRFSRADCWTRTAAGAQAVAALRSAAEQAQG